MENEILTADEIINIVELASKDVEDEIADEQELYLKSLFGMMQTFKGNPHLKEALLFLQEYYLLFFEETSFEKEVYERIRIFFSSVNEKEELLPCDNPAILEFLTELLGYFEEATIYRLTAVAGISAFIETFIYEGFMDAINYQYPLYDRSHLLSDEEKKHIFSLLPR